MKIDVEQGSVINHITKRKISYPLMIQHGDNITGLKCPSEELLPVPNRDSLYCPVCRWYIDGIAWHDIRRQIQKVK